MSGSSRIRRFAVATACVVSVGSPAIPAPASSMAEVQPGVWDTAPPSVPPAFHLSVTRSGSRWRVAEGRNAPPPIRVGRHLEFRFRRGTVRLEPSRSGAPSAFWIQPAREPLLSYPFATPLRLEPTARGWTALVRPLEPPRNLRLTIEAAADGTRSAYFREASRNHAGGRRFRIVRAGERLTLTDLRDPARVVSGQFVGGRLDLTIPDLGGTIALHRVTPVPAQTPYRYRPPRAERDGWRVADAASLGLAVAPLEGLVRRIAAEPPGPSEAAVHSVMVAYRGRLVLEEYFRGFHGEPHDIRSAGKTLTATIVGAAIGHGVPIAPETTVYPAFARRYPGLAPDPLARDMTLGDLLSMRSGYACDDEDPEMPGNEDVIAEAGGDINARILALPSVSRAGEGHPVYCSIDLHLAGATAATVAGDWLPAMFDRWVARPLDFGRYHWNLTPTGEGYGAGGAYVRPRDLLKIGQLYLSDGLWNGRRVLPEAWTRLATQQHTVFAPPPTGSQPPNPGDVHGYGYGWHRYLLDHGDRRYETYAATGNGGQFVVVVPSLDLVVGFTGGNYGAHRIWGRWLKELIPAYANAAVPREGQR